MAGVSCVMSRTSGSCLRTRQCQRRRHRRPVAEQCLQGLDNLQIAVLTKPPGIRTGTPGAGDVFELGDQVAQAGYD